MKRVRPNRRLPNKKSRYKLSTKELAAREAVTLCQLCGDFMVKPHIDHNHRCCPGRRSCGKCLRGTICGPCNRGLGFFQDDVLRLQKAIDYLNKF